MPHNLNCEQNHYGDVIMGAIASQITSLTIVYSTVYSDADQGKHQSSASLALVRGIHRGPVNSPHKWPVTRKIFPFDDVIMINTIVGPNMKWVLGQLICWDPDKMAAILQTTFSNAFSWNCYIVIKVSPTFARNGEINNGTALISIMTWRRTGDKLLSKIMA